jgi:hypothetical protein
MVRHAQGFITLNYLLTSYLNAYTLALVYHDGLQTFFLRDSTMEEHANDGR